MTSILGLHCHYFQLHLLRKHNITLLQRIVCYHIEFGHSHSLDVKFIRTEESFSLVFEYRSCHVWFGCPLVCYSVSLFKLNCFDTSSLRLPNHQAFLVLILFFMHPISVLFFLCFVVYQQIDSSSFLLKVSIGNNCHGNLSSSQCADW